MQDESILTKILQMIALRLIFNLITYKIKKMFQVLEVLSHSLNIAFFKVQHWCYMVSFIYSACKHHQHETLNATTLFLHFCILQSNPQHVYLNASPTKFKETQPQMSRITALITH